MKFIDYVVEVTDQSWNSGSNKIDVSIQFWKSDSKEMEVNIPLLDADFRFAGPWHSFNDTWRPCLEVIVRYVGTTGHKVHTEIHVVGLWTDVFKDLRVSCSSLQPETNF